ncbi:Holliday junction resolvase RuvX [Rhodospirillum rubrum]|uniref:Holliday junction resolvase RuvX n=1 Tax=Rhodospirillum rubrum TaxID=1085 RepID=UPI001905DF7B|nr:Holliday junction resolvase RuvX [Rhodospirillum rubrum]MBK1663444.1 Holliday junction resolvase RuvX [Rhodospirillum rubrum]MBK1675373.1 Holliday junction resolvase RuvX [Rhodospirillum rubrum]
MPICSLQTFAETLPPGRPVLGLDLGTRTIGVATSDVRLTLATPIITIKRRKFTLDVQELFALADGRAAAGLVLGLPVEMDGSEGPRCQATRAFARNLLALRDLPVLLWDERLSTAAVNRFLVGEADMTRARRAEVVDRAAAAYILQGALDALDRQRPEQAF